uniref:E3 ubiquitin-protein ligase Topors-like n=1 Tax=Osmia lignaria TaxID=473952 RepID=UPI0014787665|nr:E3 ubiquitin-protein ligase Topors-like [Osmia lignaria]XP_034180555.1 E3 ubiquitin-protein ligase Topors-like [Osmia lignaria]XP_034180556.1 E3 ubiquitin-protein ligase Topors-like [Osmia lignaria]XP_034180557.1 E3 ubiquitin-protein ligase Topors-like [Osmia lignaria]
MEGPLEIKDSAAGAEESIKSEAPIQNPDSSDRSDGAVSPPPNCSICLGKLVNTSFTDSCLHQFCFTCLLQWSKIKTECPLCKQTFKSIIHNVRSEEDYDQYHVPRELATLDLNFELGYTGDVGTRFHYRTTMTGHHRRPHEIVLNPEQVARREQLPSIAPRVSMEERLRRRANPTDYRRTIYRHGIWATALRDVFGRFRECSAEFYRREPRELNRLIPWLNRELQVLLLNNNPSHVAYVLRIILEALTEFDIRSPEFRDLVRPHFNTFTDHFVHELLNYARTNFDLVGYDQSVTYLPQGLSNEYLSNIISPASSSNSSSSDDSDVRVLDEAIDLRMNTEMPSVGPHGISIPGPSTVAQTFQLDIPYNAPPDILTISSDSSASDDCEVIGYVKPRHERTPEIIELVSSDPEEINVSHVPNDHPQPSSAYFEDNTQPSTSHEIKKRASSTSSTESETDSDNDYICRRSRKYQSRAKKSRRSITAKKRNRSRETRVRNRASRNLSSSGESDSRKKGTRRNIQRTMKKRMISSSDSSSNETESKAIDEKKSRTPQRSMKSMVRVRKDLIKKENRYTDDESSSSNSSSDYDETTKNTRSRTIRRSKRKYVTSSSDFEPSRNEKVTRTRGKSRQVSDTKESHRKESRYKDNRRSPSRSSSASSYTSQQGKKLNSKRRDSQRDSEDDDSWKSYWAVSRKEREFKSKSREGALSSTDFDDDHYRSHSQCSNYSSKSYTHKKKSKHKNRHKSKKKKRSNSRTRSSSNRSRLTRRHPV